MELCEWKMSNSNQAIRDVVKGASVVYVGLFLELLIAFVAQVLAARYLSVSSFGGLTTGTALLNIGEIGGIGIRIDLIPTARAEGGEARACMVRHRRRNFHLAKLSITMVYTAGGDTSKQ